MHFSNTRSADEAQLTHPDGDDRCRPRLPVDDGKFAGKRAWPEYGQYPFVAPWRAYDDFKEAVLEPIAAVAGISGRKKHLSESR